MKKYLLALSAVLAVSYYPLASAGMWEKASTFLDKVVNNSSNYNVESAGWNLRVVEWIPAENPNVRCLFAGGSKKGGVACYEVAK